MNLTVIPYILIIFLFFLRYPMLIIFFGGGGGGHIHFYVSYFCVVYLVQSVITIYVFQ